MPRTITTEYSQAVFNLPWLVAAEEGSSPRRISRSS